MGAVVGIHASLSASALAVLLCMVGLLAFYSFKRPAALGAA
jgi:hypothetical protein